MNVRQFVNNTVLLLAFLAFDQRHASIVNQRHIRIRHQQPSGSKKKATAIAKVKPPFSSLCRFLSYPGERAIRNVWQFLKWPQYLHHHQVDSKA